MRVVLTSLTELKLKIRQTFIPWDLSRVPAFSVRAAGRAEKQLGQQKTFQRPWDRPVQYRDEGLTMGFPFRPKNLESNWVSYHTFGDLNGVQTSVRRVFLITSDFHS